MLKKRHILKKTFLFAYFWGLTDWDPQLEKQTAKISQITGWPILIFQDILVINDSDMPVLMSHTFIDFLSCSRKAFYFSSVAFFFKYSTNTRGQTVFWLFQVNPLNFNSNCLKILSEDHNYHFSFWTS